MAARRLFILLAVCLPVFADSGLDAIRPALVGLRGKPVGSGGPRDATPALTPIKHQLRDWVETNLKSLPLQGDEGELQRRLNHELHDAKLTCDYYAPDKPKCPEWTLLGFVEDIRLERVRGFLVLETGVGIDCGYDESAYLYSWTDEGWHRVWQNEQNTYTEKEYKPQTIQAVLISPYSRTNDYVLLMLGLESWCSSAWHHAYYRAFRLGPDASTPPLVEGDEEAYIGGEQPIQGSVTRNDMLVQVTIRSIDSGVHNRPAIRHYEIDGDRVRRIDPLALTPRDFVDEWLTHDWREAAHWSDGAERASMSAWHKKLHKESVFGEFIYHTMHCSHDPDVWQVGVDFSDPPTPLDADPKGTYFLVRWRPPYRFSMVQVSDHPVTACNQEDRALDDEPHTLFPIQ